MKKNKTLLGVALLIAVLMLGVGYALTSIPLTLNGTMNAATNDENFRVEFTDAEASNADDTATFTTTSATYNVKSLKTVGEKATATFTITNLSKAGINTNITANEAQVTDAGQYFKVTTNLENGQDVAVNGTATYTVTVELVKAPVETAATGSFTVSFNAAAVAAN